MKLRYLFIAFLILWGIGYYLGCTNEYEQDRSTKFIVLDKLQSHGYKSSSHFYLIVREMKTQKVMEIDVRPSTYSQAKPNDCISFMMSEREIKINPEKEGLVMIKNLFYLAALIFFCTWCATGFLRAISE